jgi:hypothetical protein
MESIRTFWRSHHMLVAVLLAAALLMRAAVPSGYMVSQDAGGSLLSLCAGSTSPAALDREAIATLSRLQAIVAQNEAGHEPAREAAKVCPYAVLGQASLPGADPILLEAALAFVLALGFAALTSPALRRPAFLHPPMRAPPALI